MTRRRIPLWEAEFELLQAQEIFDEFDRLAQEEKTLHEKQERYRIRREANRVKALRLINRIGVVRGFDVWEKTKHIEPDFWGDPIPRHDEIKKLYAKQNRILWTLYALYQYWMFDEPYIGSEPRKGIRYSVQRRIYKKHLKVHHEKIKQANWDRKRARVKSRRENTERNKALKPFGDRLQGKVSELLTLRYGVGVPEIIVRPRDTVISKEALAQEFGIGKDRHEDILGLS